MPRDAVRADGRRWLWGVAVAFTVAGACWVGGSRWGWVGPSRVGGKPLRAWVEQVAAAGGVLEPPAVHEPVVEAAIDAVVSGGTGVVPELVEMAMVPLDGWLPAAHGWLPSGWLTQVFEDRWHALRMRRETALGLLARVRPPAWLMLPRIEAGLGSRDPGVREAAIRCLGCVGEPAGETVEVLSGILRSGRAADRVWAVAALVQLEQGVERAAPALVELLEQSGSGVSGLPGALGHAGSAAGAAVPILERDFEAAPPGRMKLRLALALGRIVPGHARAWSFLQTEAGNPVEGGAVMRDLAQVCLEDRIREPGFAPLLLRALESAGGRWPTGCGVVFDVLQRMDPVALARWLEARLGEVRDSDPREALEVAGMWIRHQPDHAVPRRWLRGVALEGGELAPVAAWHLGHARALDRSERDLLRSVAGAASTPEPWRRELEEVRAWVEARVSR